MSQTARPRFHYAWVIVLGGTLTTFAALGLGRFALGMLLPAMSADLGLGYARMGWVGTANFVGYLISVLASGVVTARIGPRRMVAGALVVTGLSLAGVSRAGSLESLLVLYFLTGLGSGAANVPVMSLVASWFGTRARGRAAGFIVSGSGFAILLSGWLIPLLNRQHGAGGWRASWLALAAIILAVAAVDALLLRDRPADLGLEPHGGPGAAFAPPAHHPRGIGGVLRRGALWYVGLLYVLFGFTYVIAATFMVTALVRDRGFPESVAGTFWSAVGALSLLSGPIFGTLSDRIGRRGGLALVFGLQALAYALFASGLPGWSLALAVGCYGLTVWSVPSIMTAIAADLAGPANAAAAFGFITFLFGLGQMAGPVVAGALAEASGRFASSFALASALAGLAAVLA
ncbi:MAG TPA: MFS transporter, partial [Candidatus Methanoperedens sp.]|nr:MFS transporter [Candidatus Methanoperedens sp.]